MSDSMSIDKKEPTRDGSEDGSIVSSPELEPDPSSAPQESQPAKRKGGRKPVSQTVASARIIIFVIAKSKKEALPSPLTRRDRQSTGSIGELLT